MRPVFAWYREFAPCEALRADVYAFFSFVPPTLAPASARLLRREIAFPEATFCSPQLADGHVSLVFDLGRRCDAAGNWSIDTAAPSGTVSGPLSAVGRTEGTDRPEMIGVYFRAGRAAPFLRAPISALTDTAVGIEGLWGSSSLATDLAGLDEMQRIERLESALLSRLAIGRPRVEAVQVDRLTARVVRRRGRETVDGMARDAGVSRQQLARLFKERVGVGPKLYARLARFQAGLVYAGAGRSVDWAEAALDLGYADQSHMIAEVREFSGLTPQSLADRRWFHPFIERARATCRVPRDGFRT
jgi:AraC-like DNA-binding protein